MAAAPKIQTSGKGAKLEPLDSDDQFHYDVSRPLLFEIAWDVANKGRTPLGLCSVKVYK